MYQFKRKTNKFIDIILQVFLYYTSSTTAGQVGQIDDLGEEFPEQFVSL